MTKNDKNTHSFHIPVMGTAFSIDTPIKVAKYGISSVISIVDDSLVEEMRKHYCTLTGEDYVPITKHDDDYRARRITAYLDLVDRIVKNQFQELKNSAFKKGTEIIKYFQLLSDKSPLKELYSKMLSTTNPSAKAKLEDKLRSEIKLGDINVNIMTKLDRANFDKKKQDLPAEYSDALSALRGYAKSSLESAIVFSAGINRRLYSYVEEFKDFYADTTGFIKKKIILKVSDYRSTLIQGKFFAKKGLWVSEYRVESGLNCGGHAFATDGYLMGPILEEFKNKKAELIENLHKIYSEALKIKEKISFANPLPIKITAQGGIGTAKENEFLLKHYEIDGTGWATPFLLVPEVTNVDRDTLIKLAGAREADLYLSDVSPLGVPFNNLRDSASDMARDERVTKNRPGSPCPKGHLVSNTEFTEKPICTASRQYQKLKLEQLEELDLDPETKKHRFVQVTSKSCICNDLSEPAMINNHLGNGAKRFTAICPGPNMAYFSKIATLDEMVSHIYGRLNLLNSTYRPNMFIKELKMYIEYFMKEAGKVLENPTDKQKQYLAEFKKNLFEGMEYYKELIPRMLDDTLELRTNMLSELQDFKEKLEEYIESNSFLFPNPLQSAVAA